MKINCDYFQIQKWKLQIVTVEKLQEKSEVICVASMFPFCLWHLNCLKKYIASNFVLTSAENLSLFKQFT